MEDEDQKNEPGGEAGKPPPPAGFHVDHRLADHRAARHAADEAGGGIGDALADTLLIAVGFRVGQVVDKALRHQAFQKADHGDGQRIGQDDRQRCQRKRDVGDQEHRQRVGQFAHVADGADVPAEGHGKRREDKDGDERRGDGLGHKREQVDDRQARRDKDIGQPGDGSWVKLGQ